MTLKIGSLFSGYGGLDAGVSSVLDAETVWFSEYDKGPSKILAHRFPDVPNHGDITKIDWSQVEPVDILTGGSPCQDLSHAGRRAGMTEGTRSNLWVAMREAVAQLRPSLVVWENVGGAFSAAADSEVEPCAGCVGDGSGVHLRALGRVLGDLASLGFDAEWVALRAADVGAPHGRLRVFVTAYPQGDSGWQQHGDRRAPAFARGVGRNGRQAQLGGTSGLAAGDGEGALLPSPRTSDTNGAGHHGDGGLDLRTAVSLLPTPRAGDGEKGGPNQRGSSGDFMLPSAVTHLLPTPAVNDMGASYTPDEWDAWTDRMKSEHGNGNGHGKSLHIEAARLLPTPTTMDSHASGGGYNGQTNVTLTDATTRPDMPHVPEWGQYAAAIHRWESLTRPAPAPTETGPKGNPRLSAAFSEWMMGLPSGWVTDVPGITRNEALKALGNGVCPQQCAAALRVLLGHSEVAA